MKNYIEQIQTCISNTLPKWDDAVGLIIQTLLMARSTDKTIYFIGNGGSAGIAVHMAADFQKTGEFKTRTFYDPSLITCLANDYGYEYVFSKPLELFARAGDVLIAISSSGNSINIVNAADTARARGCKVISFTGFSPDNKLRAKGDIDIYVPSFSYGIVESLHNMMLQQVMDEIETGRTE